MFRAVFFLRIWKQNIILSRSYTLQNHFITPNAHSGIEMNAKNLIILLKKFRDQNHHELFLPPIFDSQTCENFFRLYRSMGTTQCTKINFSLYELIHMIGRVEVQHDIAYFKLRGTPIQIPNMRVGKTKVFPLPADAQINEIIAKAKQEALRDATALGMNCSNHSEIDDYHFKEPQVFKSMLGSEDECNDGNSDEESYAESTQEDPLNGEDMDGEAAGELNETHSHYVTIMDESGVERLVRKTTYLWMLTEGYDKLSNDRLKRFQKKGNMKNDLEDGKKRKRNDKKRKVD